jgi:hypothetical protein
MDIAVCCRDSSPGNDPGWISGQIEHNHRSISRDLPACFAG